MTVVAACLSMLPSAADPLPDAATLRDLADAAAGPAPDAYREVIAFTGTAGSGTESYVARGKDHRDIIDAGSLHTESGINNGEAWHENINGHVIVDEPDPGVAVKETYTTTVGRVSKPVDAYVLSEVNARGYGTRDYYDPATHELVRRERITGAGTVTTEYADFRTFGSRRIPGRWTVNDTTSAVRATYTVTDYAATAVSDADVAVPQQKRMLVEYPPGVNRVVLPSRFEPSGHVIVRATINGRGLDFILDTGSSGITLDPDVAYDLGLTMVERQESSANAGRYVTGIARVPQMTIGALQMRDTYVSIVPWGVVEPNVKSVGLMGFDFLCESGITIDYVHEMVIAERYGSYGAPPDPGTIAIDVRLRDQVPETTLTIDGAVAERVLVDTGAVGPFMLFDYFERRHPEVVNKARSGQPRPFLGAGGVFLADSIKLATIDLGSVTFKDFQGFAVTTRGAFSGDRDGVIGPNFLRYFDVHLDYPNAVIYLVPNANAQRFAH